jgi:hypothetical protein
MIIISEKGYAEQRIADRTADRSLSASGGGYHAKSHVDNKGSGATSQQRLYSQPNSFRCLIVKNMTEQKTMIIRVDKL